MDGDKKIGHKVIATVEKCRGGPNGWQAEFWLDFYRGHVRSGEEIAKLGAAYDVVKRPNNTTWVYEDFNVRGKDNFFGKLEEDKDLANRILSAVKEKKAAGEDRLSAVLDIENEEAAGQMHEVMETAQELGESGEGN